MALTKTWLTTSRNPRDSHGRIAGETVGINDVFGNGLLYPGDGNMGAEEVANCRCIMLIGGKSNRALPRQTADEWRTLRDSWLNDLSPSDRAFMSDWESTRFNGITGKLREHQVLTAEEQALVAKTDDVMRLGHELGDTTLYRGGIKGIENMNVGDRWIDEAFPFASSNPAVASQFSQGQAIFELKVQPELRAIFGNYDNMTEYVLPRGLDFRIIAERQDLVRVWQNGQWIEKEVKVFTVRVRDVVNG